MQGFTLGVKRNPRFTLSHARADHRATADFEPVIARQHDAPGLAGAGTQDGPALAFIDQENTGVIQIELLADQIHRLRQQLIQREDGRRHPRDFRRCEKP